MDPCDMAQNCAHIRLPRASGDGPYGVSVKADDMQAAPRERGWTFWPTDGSGWLIGCPARAGMDPT